jgi:type II secretion system protein N
VLESASVDLSMAGPTSSYYFDKITISPSFLALLTFKAGADVRLESGKGVADLSARLGKSSQSVSFKLKDVILGAFGTQPGGAASAAPVDFFNPNPMTILSNLKKSGTLNGTGSFSGDFTVPNTLDGETHIDVSKLVIDQQTLAGFALPRMSISEGKIEVATEKGKLVFKNVKLGKTGDDVRATLTGDMVLGKSWDTSLLNAKVNFGLSENVTKALVLVDALLAPGKQPDGTYTYTLGGMLSGPNATPGGK